MIDTTKGFTLVREFDASPEEIWRAWVDPDEAAQWWHPRGVSTPRDSVEIDATVGGHYTYTMVNDRSGEKYPTAGIYREVVENERLVFTWGNPDDDDEDRPLITVSIEPLGELTRMTFDLRGWQGMSGDGDVYDGWESALDSFAEQLAR
jgi:uncharacterized protein YndB with AHSA1/START domain